MPQTWRRKNDQAAPYLWRSLPHCLKGRHSRLSVGGGPGANQNFCDFLARHWVRRRNSGSPPLDVLPAESSNNHHQASWATLMEGRHEMSRPDDSVRYDHPLPAVQQTVRLVLRCQGGVQSLNGISSAGGNEEDDMVIRQYVTCTSRETVV